MMLGSQLYDWRQDPSIAGVRAQSREPDISQPASKVTIPVDTLVSSASYWQKHHGCQTGSLRYSGYSAHDKQRIAVVFSGGQEHLYSVGDELVEAPQARIIALDDQTVVLRYPDKITVLCRDGQKTPENIRPLAQVNLSPSSSPSMLDSPLGTLAPVSDKVGNVMGYRLQKCLRYCWLMRQFSLQEGDTITAIQGIRVGQILPAQLDEILIHDRRDITVTLQRGAETKSVTLPWKRIASLTHFLKKGDAQ